MFQDFFHHKLHIFSTLFSGRVKDLSPLKTHMTNLPAPATWLIGPQNVGETVKFCLRLRVRRQLLCTLDKSLLHLWSLLYVALTTKQQQSRAQQAATPCALCKEQGQLLAVSRFSSVEAGSCLSFKFQQQTQGRQHVPHSCCGT